MMQWFWKKRLWASVLGTTAALGLAFGQTGTNTPSGPPKVGDVITLKFSEGDRQFKVMKVDKQKDGYYSEVKDTKTGETITVFESGGDAPAKQPDAAKSKDPLFPKAKPKANDPLLPPNSSATSSQDKNPSTAKTNNPTGAATPDQSQDPPKRPGFFARIFGPKKTTPPANTNTQSTNSQQFPAPNSAMPPAVRPTPGLFPPAPSGMVEPPRVSSEQPVSPHVPLFPGSGAPSTPAASPAVPTPLPLPPAPMVPGLPSIPIPPSGMSKNNSEVIQANCVSPETAALMKDIKPYVTVLRTAWAPSERVQALQSLAGCRHASTETVKSVLFNSCVADPCPLVRACCIDELCKLGYYDPAFLQHLTKACNDPTECVRDAAKEALKRMTIRK
jgi:hypothetical protein